MEQRRDWFYGNRLNSMGPIGALLALLLCCACGKGEEPPESPEGKGRPGPNLLLVTLDTARADHFGCYGSSRVKTPVMDRLAGKGILFSNTTTPTPLTLPSHSSLFTGESPVLHGVRDNGGFELKDAARTLAEILRDQGWKTAGFISAYVLHAGSGIAQGFDVYSDTFEFERAGVINAATVQRKGRETVEEALAWLEENHRQPFFLWVHLFDPHSPYDPPEPHRSEYPNDPYAGEIAYTDEALGVLVDRLESLGRASDTVVAVLGDHGEGRGDHLESFHGLFVYNESIQVPFILIAPGYPSRRVDAQVRLIDVMPTLLDLAGAGNPSAGQADSLLHGQSLMPLIRGEMQDLKLAAYCETFYPSLHYGWSNLYCLRTGKYKYIDAPRPELYDVESDPCERRNLIDSKPETARRLKAAMDELRQRTSEARLSRKEHSGMDSQSMEALRRLGYAGGSSPSAALEGQEERPLPDPKDKVEILNMLEEGQRLMTLGQPRKALPLLREVVEREPDMADGLITLAAALYQAEDYAYAVDVLQHTLKIAPAMLEAWMNLGLCFERLNRAEEALAAFERAAAIDPSNTEILARLAASYFKLGRFNEVLETGRRCLKEDSNSARMRSFVAMAHVNLGQFNEAEVEAKKGLAQDPEAENLHYVLGKILQSRRRYADSATAYEEEIRLHLKNVDAFRSLEQVCEKLKDPDRSKRALEAAIAKARRALEANPSSNEARAAWEALEELREE